MTETAWKHSYGSMQNWVTPTELSVRQLSPVSVMTPIANCSLVLPAINTQHLLYPTPEREHHYTQSFRQRSHNFQLPDRTSVLRDENFIMRMLYCDALY